MMSYFSNRIDGPIERVTNATPCISENHSLIHEGLARTLTGTFGAGTSEAAIGLKPTAEATASVEVVMTDTDANILYTFYKAGTEGNDWSVTHVDPQEEDAELSVSVAGQAITVSLATDEAGTITSLSEDVVEAVNAHAEASRWVIASEAGGGGTVNAVAEASLIDGANNVYVHFKPVSIASSIDVTTVKLHENATFTGTAINPMWVPVDPNRITKNTSEVVITSTAGATVDVTADDYALLFTKTARGSAQGTGRFEGSIGAPEEIVLKPGVQYVLSMERAGSTAIDFQLFWYEEETA